MKTFTVIDIKTGFEMLPATAIQMSAYDKIWEETLSRKEAIDLSFDEENHLYRLGGSPLISVTQVLQKSGLVDYSAVPIEILEKARKFGTAAHKACELRDLGRLDERTLDPNLWPYVDAWTDFVQDYSLEFEAIEKPICSTIYRTAGTPDRIAKSDKRRRLAVLLQPDGKYKVTEYKDKADFNIFLAALTIVNWKGANK